MAEKMDVQMVDVDDLRPNPNNPRANDGAIAAVGESIRQFGFRVPLIIGKDNLIIAGHTRYRAAIIEGMEKVPCVVADDLSEEQQAALTVAENRTSDFSFFDIEKLGEFVEDIPEEMLAAFDVDTLLHGLDEEEAAQSSDKAPEKRQGLDLAPFEKYQYVMIMCRTEHDYLNLTQRLGLEDTQRRYVDGVLKRGSSYGRVIEYPEFLERMKEGE